MIKKRMESIYFIRPFVAMALAMVIATTSTMASALEQVKGLVAQPSNTTPDCVILLHGLARQPSSMRTLQTALVDEGFVVANIAYPSRTAPVEDLAAPAIEKGLDFCNQNHAKKRHVVTHSMGGILFRQYVSVYGADVFSKTIMLGPPNNGSEVVDAFKEVPGFKWLNGPAGLQLGTDKLSVPNSLGVAQNDTAIIAGTTSINHILSAYLPSPDDGKVSVDSTRLEGMCAHLQVAVSHPSLMKNKQVILEVIHYLETGRFLDETAEYPKCEFRT